MGDTGPLGAEQRREPRRRVNFPARLQESLRETECVVRDISASGALLLVARQPPAPSAAISLKIDRVGFVTGKVAWADGNRVGAEFNKIPPAMVERINKL